MFRRSVALAAEGWPAEGGGGRRGAAAGRRGTGNCKKIQRNPLNKYFCCYGSKQQTNMYKKKGVEKAWPGSKSRLTGLLIFVFVFVVVLICTKICPQGCNDPPARCELVHARGGRALGARRALRCVLAVLVLTLILCL